MSRLFILLALISILSCDNENEASKAKSPKLFINPHSSAGELYAGIPVQCSFRPPVNELILETSVDFGDLSEPAPYQHVYTVPSTYTIVTTVRTNRHLYRSDTTITVAQGPKVFGTSNVRERGMLIYNSAPGRYNIMVESNSGSSVNNYYLLKLSHSLEPNAEKPNLNFDWYPDIGPSLTTKSGELVISVDAQLKVYSPEGNQSSNYYLRGYPNDLQMIGNTVEVVYDSSKFAVINSIDIETDETTFAKQFMGVEDMTAYGYFFTGDSTVTGFYRSSNNLISLVMSAKIKNEILFSHYFNEQLAIQNITPISSGLLMNTYASAEFNTFRLIKFDTENQVEWQRQITLDYENYNSGSSYTGYNIIAKEKDGSLYVFFDNMRCVKLTQQGKVIWDHFFYPRIVRLNDVEITPEGNFILLGTRQYDSEIQDFTYDYNKADIIYLMISPDGTRVLN